MSILKKLIRKRKSLYHKNESEHVYTFYISHKRNPCGCGSNCYHYELDGKKIFGVCNSCGKDIYQIMPEYFDEYLNKGVWK